jgi:hypothetical protein
MRKTRLLLVGLFALLTAAFALPALAAQVSGAIFTTDSTCSGVDLNIYGNKDDVYLNGGPAHQGAAGLPDGYYYVQVTEPGGTLLGTSVGSTNETPVHVTNGEFDQCYQLSDILIKASDGTQGYDDTSNPGGEYKAWVGTESPFTNSNTKTDNFKVKPQDGGGPPPQATLHVRKYYDANANGQYDMGEIYLTGWKFRIHDNIDWIRYTPADMVVDPDEYWVSEFKPNETNWIGTDTGMAPNDPQTGMPTKYYNLADKDDVTAKFGNVCVGAGGGLTLGFWSNNNGQAIMKSNDNFAGAIAFLNSLNLRNANGTEFNITQSGLNGYKQYRTWLLGATATNMAHVLSAQLSAMELNVRYNKVGSGKLIYVPGTTSANAQGFATVNAVMNEANQALGVNNVDTSKPADGIPDVLKIMDGNQQRPYYEALKNALDRGNNNLNFVQPSACAYTFTP